MGKHESGLKKRNRKEKKDELVQSQRGAMDKFVKKSHNYPLVMSQLTLLHINYDSYCIQLLCKII
jgi:hypothetical protein